MRYVLSMKTLDSLVVEATKPDARQIRAWHENRADIHEIMVGHHDPKQRRERVSKWMTKHSLDWSSLRRMS